MIYFQQKEPTLMKSILKNHANLLIMLIMVQTMAFTQSCSDDSNSSQGPDDDWTHPWNPNYLYGEFEDKRDGHVYKATVIGSQTWMAQNLNYERGIGGSECYQHKAINCNKYGRLYNFEAAMEVCPEGWRLPHTDEWNTLSSYIISRGSPMHLKAAEGRDGDNNNGDDSYGFTALPGGWGGNSGDFHDIGTIARWWTDVENSGSLAHYASMGGNSFYTGSGGQLAGESIYFSVRCILDNENIGGSL
jgi:uncharacterized protein (TIGR02145 family)